MPENLQEKRLTDCVSYGLDITLLEFYLRNQSQRVTTLWHLWHFVSLPLL